MQNKENTNEWINWIEEAITKKHIKYYEYDRFINIQEIGTGGFGKVFRAKWKNIEQYLALKSFFNFNGATVKEVVREVIINYIIHLVLCNIYCNIQVYSYLNLYLSLA